MTLPHSTAAVTVNVAKARAEIMSLVTNMANLVGCGYGSMRKMLHWNGQIYIL